MFETGLAIAVALFTWWFSTGAILFLNQLPPNTFKVSVSAATLIAAVAMWGIAITLDQATVTGAYVGFFGGLALWGWHELSFLTGSITGPRRGPCPEGLAGWARFKAATGTLITHEIAIFLTLIALVAVSYGAVNATAAITFASLWVLRLSAKFNIFLGIPNLSDEFLPAHLEYLKTYFRKRPMNGLFPLSVTVGTLAAVALLRPAFADGSSSFEVTAALLVGSLVALGVVEHWLMVLPVRDAALWQWAMGLAEYVRPSSKTSGALERSAETAPQKFDFKTREAIPDGSLTPALIGGDTR